MKYIKQFTIIALIALIGELISYLVPVTIPGSIYGFAILFLGLCTKIIPLDAVKEAGHFFVDIMVLTILPAAVGLMNVWDVFSNDALIYLLASIVGTLIVMVVSGRVTQWLMKKTEKGGK